MADYTALMEAGTALVEMLRDNLTPEPLGDRELIALCSPHENENNQLTLYLYHLEEESGLLPGGPGRAADPSGPVQPALSGDRPLQGACPDAGSRAAADHRGGAAGGAG